MEQEEPVPELSLAEIAARLDRLEQAIGKDAIGAGIDNLDYRLRRVVAKLSELVKLIQAREE